jgi:hypothetical protein
MSDIWSKVPTPDPRPPSEERSAPWWWDHSPDGAAVALRHRDGRVLLVLAQDGQSWGIYQLQLYGDPVYKGEYGSEWELIQIRATKSDARDAAIEMAERAGLLK